MKDSRRCRIVRSRWGWTTWRWKRKVGTTARSTSSTRSRSTCSATWPRPGLHSGSPNNPAIPIIAITLSNLFYFTLDPLFSKDTQYDSTHISRDRHNVGTNQGTTIPHCGRILQRKLIHLHHSLCPPYSTIPNSSSSSSTRPTTKASPYASESRLASSSMRVRSSIIRFYIDSQDINRVFEGADSAATLPIHTRPRLRRKSRDILEPA